MRDLSPQRAAVLSFIQERVQILGQSPSLAEIAAQFGFASINSAKKHVQGLADAGLIELVPNQRRGIRIFGREAAAELVTLPILGRVAAGVPIGADIGLDQELRLDRRLFSLTPHYLLLVQGDSMIEDGILDGDLVGVHRVSEARNGQTVVARIDEELTIKRLEHVDSRIRLLPRNQTHDPIVVEPGQDFAIEGIYCGLVRRG